MSRTHDKTRPIVLGSFNNQIKNNAISLNIWANILQRIDDAALLLKGAHYMNPKYATQIQTYFSQRSIKFEKLHFEGESNHAAHLTAYNKIDIALDTWPYSGGLTTCVALYMGILVITLPGQPLPVAIELHILDMLVAKSLLPKLG